MDSRLKTRVIGAIALSALAIIILPLLLDGTPQERARAIKDVPPPPPMEMAPFDAQEFLEDIERMEAAAKEPLPPLKLAEESRGSEPFQLDEDGLPQGWSLQVGSFVEERNAFSLRDRLRDHGYSTYLLAIDTESGKTLRVMVGPLLEKAKLEGLRQQIVDDFSLEGRIVPYRMEDDKFMVGG